MKIEGYEIIKEISRGPITTVFLGKQLALERQVLIKLLNAQWQREADLIERFRREAIICARLKHPNIVSIYDVGTHADNLYLVIEYIEGEDLGQFLKRHRHLPVELALFISRELIAGLAYAHSQGIIHRDIKPGNIMVSREGAVKITDFGLARTEDLPSITAQGGTVGTPAYMSPEQSRGEKLDQRSDIFSLGVTLYELAGGESPFRGDNFADSIQKVLKNNPPPLRQIRPDTPNWFSGLVEGMLHKDPHKRPASAKEVLNHPGFHNLPANRDRLAAFIIDPAGFRPREKTVEKPVRGSFLRPSHRLPAAIFGAVLLLALAILFSRNGRQEPPAGNRPLANPAAPAQVSDSLNAGDGSFSPAQPDSASQPSFTAGNSAAQNRSGDTPAQTPSPGASGSGYQPARRGTPSPGEAPSPVKKTGERMAAQDSLAERASSTVPGGLFVVCAPWADVFIDGQKKDTTPLRQPLLLPPGMYHLELKNPGFETYRRQVAVEPGKTDSLVVNLRPRDGYLVLRVMPWAEVYIDGKYYETTPLKHPISLPSGKYEIKLVNPNFSAWADSVAITAGETASRQVTLSK